MSNKSTRNGIGSTIWCVVLISLGILVRKWACARVCAKSLCVYSPVSVHTLNHKNTNTKERTPPSMKGASVQQAAQYLRMQPHPPGCPCLPR